MYGVVEISGHQYRVCPGDLIDVEKLADEAGTMVEFDKVLFIGGENIQVGLPSVEGAKVTAKVLKHAKERKLIVFKRKPGHRTVKKGHRQNYTALLITEINDGKGNNAAIDPESKAAVKFLK
ncbi:MAG: 50S ribosomal protein L21 [Bacteriovoracaceae bacterium]|nr:50S ribosomal protein L21 [Bacteriovoracaceae bacterium]